MSSAVKGERERERVSETVSRVPALAGEDDHGLVAQGADEVDEVTGLHCRRDEQVLLSQRRDGRRSARSMRPNKERM
jgi:hypothetical protein